MPTDVSQMSEENKTPCVNSAGENVESFSAKLKNLIMERSGRHWQIDRQKDVRRDVHTDKDTTSDNTICVEARLYVWVFFVRSHDFIGEFTTSYRELSRGQNQFNVYEVRHDRSCLLCLNTFDL